jgi:hypothetical protein
MATERPRRWPAYALAVLFLGYAAGKAAFAARGRLGFPGGPPVSLAEHEAYARGVVDPAVAQWLASGTGLAAALIVVATVTGRGRRVARVPVLLGLAGVGLGTASGTTIMVLDRVVGLGVGWSWYHGAVGLAAVALLVATTGSYLQATRRPARQSPVAEKCIVSAGDENVAPQVQPMAANASVTTSPSTIMPGRFRERSV